MQNCKILENNLVENLDNVGYGEDVLDKTHENSFKLETCALGKTVLNEWEDEPQTGWRNSQKTHLVKDR